MANQDEVIRFDVDDAEVPDELVHAIPAPEKIDLDLDVERLILARRIHHHLTFYAGLHRTGRVLWVKDARLAKVFESESDVLTEVFQFGGADEDAAVLKEVFVNLNLQMLPAPPLPSVLRRTMRALGPLKTALSPNQYQG
ncbi:MAG: hypothetical protein DMG49_13065 [Acidobacteria bacterium]|nr:MAG: hypothetical protein DMG49_13065 [Acidobacteriota bacterium]